MNGKEIYGPGLIQTLMKGQPFSEEGLKIALDSKYQELIKQYEREANITMMAPKLDKENIPANLEEALDYLEQNSSKEYLDLVRDPEMSKDTIVPHIGYRRYMRNTWGLWTDESPLANWFRGIGLNHADDMYAVIECAFYCRINNKQFDLDEQIAYYQKYGEESKLI